MPTQVRAIQNEQLKQFVLGSLVRMKVLIGQSERVFEQHMDSGLWDEAAEMVDQLGIQVTEKLAEIKSALQER